MNYKKTVLISGIIALCFYLALVFVTVTRVSDINVNYSAHSFEDYELCMEVLSDFKGKNLLFLNTEDVEERVVASTGFKVKSVKKRYPFTLEVNLYSDEERFAVIYNDEIYVLDNEYVVLKTRETLINPADNLSDVLIEFKTALKPTVELKKPLGYPDEVVFNALKTALSCFSSPRDYLSSVAVIETPEKGNYRIEINMRSGLKILVYKATEKTSEKVLAAISKYKELTDGDLICGVIESLMLDSGKITAVYTRKTAG